MVFLTLFGIFRKPLIFVPIGIILICTFFIDKKASPFLMWLISLLLGILAIIYIVRYIIRKITHFTTKRLNNNDSTLTYDNSQWVDVTKKQSPLFNTSPKIDTSEDLTLRCIKQFKPRWIERNGKFRLEGGENGNNANLAQQLRDYNIPDIETEITLKNGSRADLMIDNQIIIECKPHLLSVEKLHSISGEIRRVKRIGNYKVFALIYGDAKSYLLEELKADIGENNVIVLGEVNGSN
jgi:hypothetical protein